MIPELPKVSRRAVLLGISALAAAPLDAAPATRPASARRLGTGPIITPASHPSIGTNINGPSLIRVPDWIERPLGRYYLYFAAHAGRAIRLAYADALEGPWKVHPPGALRNEQTPFPARLARAHIASPDAHVDDANKRIVLYYHGLESEPNLQLTRAAVSTDGLTFTSGKPVLGLPYMRVFRFGGVVHGLAMPGQFYRASDLLNGFRAGPQLFDANMRHAAVLAREGRLLVAWTQVGDAPERIYLSVIDASGPWDRWKEAERTELLRPERVWEGANLPARPSQRGIAVNPVNQLRDPCLFEEAGRVFMVYAIAGEQGLAVAEIFL